VSEAAADALGKIGGSDAAKPLVSALEDKDASTMTRRRAIQSLAALGADAKPAVAALMKVAQEKPKGKKGDKKKMNEDDLRGEAIGALGAIGPGAKDAIPFLTELSTAKKGDRGLKRAATEALKKIGKE